jgi:hypothetical protein
LPANILQTIDPLFGQGILEVLNINPEKMTAQQQINSLF